MIILKYIRYAVLSVLMLCPMAQAGVAVLSPADVSSYRLILDFQKRGNISAAKKEQAKIQDDMLMGYVLFDRYFLPSYNTTPKEITAWFQNYDDLPVAPDMYVLGGQKNVKKITRPRGIFGGNTAACSNPSRQEPIDLIRNLSFSYLDGARRTLAQKKMRQIERYIQNGKTLNAKQLLMDKKTIALFSQQDIDAVRTALAFQYFLDGNDALALRTAQDALRRSSRSMPLAYWVAGLVSWRQGDIVTAADYFSAAATHAHARDGLRTSASFWAARAYLRSNQFDQVGDHIERAMASGRSFYGILAMRLFGRDLEHVWDEPSSVRDEVTADFSHPALARFYALRQIGQDDWAQKELSKLYLDADDEARGILMMISERNGFAKELRGLTGELGGDTARYPAPNWTPAGGWTLDKALVYAFVRQESCFNQRAQSSRGAMGLMQIMPATGKELAQNLQYPFSNQRLKDPEYNLALGQAYLQRLMENSKIKNNIMWTAVAYNAGPGNLNKWDRRMNYNQDPLMFLESIPSKETRGFVERIMANYWVYRSLMNQSLESLDDVIAGRWPVYKQCD